MTAVERAVSVLECFDRTPLSLTQVARATGFSEATALRYVSTLARAGFLERGGDGRYRLGLRLFQFGQRALADRDPRAVALPLMERLLERFQETVNLAMRHGDLLVLIEVLESRRSIKKGASIGDLDRWHCSGLGKSILAHLPEEEIIEILDRWPLKPLTPTTLTSPDDLRVELEDVRARGFALDNEEAEEGLRCVGAPIFDARGRPAYALSLSGPAYRFEPDTIDEMGEQLCSAASLVSAQLGFDATNREGATGREKVSQP